MMPEFATQRDAEENGFIKARNKTLETYRGFAIESKHRRDDYYDIQVILDDVQIFATCQTVFLTEERNRAGHIGAICYMYDANKYTAALLKARQAIDAYLSK